MNNKITVYTADLGCPLLKRRGGGLYTLLLLFAVAGAAVVGLTALSYVMESVSFSSGAVLWLLIAAVCVVVGFRITAQQKLRRMGRSALVVEGDKLTLITLSLENEFNTCEALTGSAAVSMKNGFTTEDVLGFGLSNTGRKKSSSAYNEAMLKMQDRDFVLDKYRSGYGGVKLTVRYGCRVESQNEKELVISGSRDPGGEAEQWKLPSVFGQVTI